MSLKRNTFWNLAGGGLPLLAAALCIPYCLRLLGNEAFGVLTLIWALIGYFSLFDFGTGRALTYELAQLRSSGQGHKIPVALKAGLLLTLLTGILGTIFMLGLAPVLTQHWLHLSAPLQTDAYLAFQIAALGVIPTTMTSGLRGAMEGLEKFPASNLNKIFFGFCMFSLPALSIQMHGQQLRWITFYLVAARLLFLLIGLLQLKKYLLPNGTPLNNHNTEANHNRSALIPELQSYMRQIFSYGFWLTVSGIISPLMVYGDRFFIGSLLGTDQVSFYAIPQEGLLRMLALPIAITGALLPVFATLSTLGEVRQMYEQHFKRLAKLMGLVSLCAALIAYPALRIWLSEEFANKAIFITLLLLCGTYINALALMPYTLLHARGKTQWTAYFHLGELGVYSIILIFFTQQFGLIGAALAWVGRVTLDFLLLRLAAKRLMQNNPH